MDFGIGYFPTYNGISPGDLAKLVEEHGQSRLFFSEHTHIPAESQPPPGMGEMRTKYWQSYDLFVALTAAALATSRLRVGSAICQVPQREPITTAKAVASIDHLSGGRVDFGVGAGWNRLEMRNHGTDPSKRMAVLRERIEAMKAIWTQAEASYSGEFVNFNKIRCEPKPTQRPHPPILVGGSGETVLDRVLAFGDSWFPNYPDLDEGRVADLRARTDRTIEVDAVIVPPAPDALERCARLGLRSANFWIAPGGRSSVERELEKWEAAIAQFIGP